jgi:hypothetical protein
MVPSDCRSSTHGVTPSSSSRFKTMLWTCRTSLEELMASNLRLVFRLMIQSPSPLRILTTERSRPTTSSGTPLSMAMIRSLRDRAHLTISISQLLKRAMITNVEYYARSKSSRDLSTERLRRSSPRRKRLTVSRGTTTER